MQRHTSTNMCSNSNLQLPIAWAFDTTSSRQDHSNPWGGEHVPLRQCLAWTSALELGVWQKDCRDINLNNQQLLLSSTFQNTPVRCYFLTLQKVLHYCCKRTQTSYNMFVTMVTKYITLINSDDLCGQTVYWTVWSVLSFLSFDPLH